MMLHPRTNFGDNGKSLHIPLPIANTEHMGTPCNEHERIIKVVRYGRIYRRKTPDCGGHNICTNAPAGMRWCKMCQDFKPLEAFYTRVKRYVCRRHHWLRIKGTIERRVAVMGKDQCLAAIEAWRALKAACPLLGYDRQHIDKTDIRLLIQHARLPLQLQPVLCPIDPNEGMWPSNIAVLSHPAFDLLMSMYQFTNSRALFVAMVQRCNLLPFNFDVSRPADPWHDPHFVRTDHDAAQLLLAEEQEGGKKAETMDESVLAELAADGDVPWNDAKQKQALVMAVRGSKAARALVKTLQGTVRERAASTPKQTNEFVAERLVPQAKNFIATQLIQDAFIAEYNMDASSFSESAFHRMLNASIKTAFPSTTARPTSQDGRRGYTGLTLRAAHHTGGIIAGPNSAECI